MTLRLYSARQPLLAWHLEKARPEGCCEGHDGAGVVDVFVDELVVEADAMAGGRRLGHQRRFRERVIDIIKNQRRFGDDQTVVHQGWHHPVRIEL
jgi:hypothetical protein